jgi:hypothetical protein
VGTTQAQRDRATAIATEIVWRLSGMRFGLCPLVVRPCGRSCEGSSTYYMAHGTFPVWQPNQVSGGFVNCLGDGCGCASPCSCCAVCEVLLPYPVSSVTSVKVDGILVPPSAYRVDDHRELVRTDGGTCWPRCQNLSLPGTAAGTFEVSYLRGTPVPAGGLAAAGVYACEVLKACIGGPCRLPARVQTISREGVTIAVQDTLDFLDKGLTGIPEVDAWIRAVNPGRLQAYSQVYSVDVEVPRVSTS